MSFPAYHFFFENISSQTALKLVVGLLLLLTGMYFYLFKKSSVWYYSFIFIGTFMVGLGMASASNFLFEWDEQFHAVVAKSMMENPLKPTLLGEKYNFGYQYWTANHVWLHKQPLFLWQIALSFKLFGVNLLSLRLPSVLLHAATTLLVLSIAKRYLSRNLALLAAMMFGLSDFQLGMVSGSIGKDHNDISFVFYTAASFWAWIKYQESKQFKWVVWIGLFCGAAILSKWLVGLIVFSGWGIVLMSSEMRSKKAWKDMFISLLIAIVVAMPWQLYCYFNYRNEFLFEMNYNSLHLFKGIESHTGNYLFYFDAMFKLYGQGLMVPIIIFAGLLIMLIQGIRKQNYYFLFGSSVFLVVFLFFSIAATKIIAYLSITMVFGYIAFLTPMNLLFQIKKVQLKLENLKKLKFFLPVILLFFSLLFVQIKEINHHCKFSNPEHYNLIQTKMNYVLAKIKKDNNPSKIYFIKDDNIAHLSIQLKFRTNAKVFPYNPYNVFEGVGEVIDVNGIGED